MIQDEDHTLGNILRYQLLKDKNVKFSGYKRPHPLEHKIEIKVQTDGQKTPIQAVYQGCGSLTEHIDQMEAAFREAIQRHKGEVSNADMFQGAGGGGRYY